MTAISAAQAGGAGLLLHGLHIQQLRLCSLPITACAALSTAALCTCCTATAPTPAQRRMHASFERTKLGATSVRGTHSKLGSEWDPRRARTSIVAATRTDQQTPKSCGRTRCFLAERQQQHFSTGACPPLRQPSQHQAPAAHLALPLRRARPFMRLPSAMNWRTPSCTPRVTGFCADRGGSYLTQ